MTLNKSLNPNESNQCRLCGLEKDESELIPIDNSIDKQLLYELLEIQVPEKAVAKCFCEDCKYKLRILGMHDKKPCIKSKRLKIYEEFKVKAIESARQFKKLDDSRVLSERLAAMKQKRLSDGVDGNQKNSPMKPKRIKVDLR